MSDEDWQTIKTKVEDWKVANPDWEEQYEEDLWGLDRYLQRGDVNANRRNSIKTLLREMFFEVNGSPFTSSRLGAGLTGEMVTARDALLTDAMRDLAVAFDSSPALRAIMTKNGKAGGGFFTTGAECANYTLATSGKTLLNRMFKGTDNYGRKWNGEYNPETVEWFPTQETQDSSEVNPKKKKK